MFGTILISICTVIHVYVFWRISSMPMMANYLSGKQITGIGVGLWLILFLSRFYAHHHTGKLAYIVELMGMNWLGFLFLIFTSLAAAEIITGFGFLFPGVAIKIREAAFITGIILSVIALVQGTRLPVIEKYEVTIPGLPDNLDGKVIVAVSDLHIGSLRGGDWLTSCIEEIQNQRPDMVCLLGDIFEGHALPDQMNMARFKTLSAPLGVYAVLGNHEFHDNAEEIARLMEQNGIQVLRNQNKQIQPGLVLAGIDDLRSFRRRMDVKTGPTCQGTKGSAPRNNDSSFPSTGPD